VQETGETQNTKSKQKEVVEREEEKLSLFNSERKNKGNDKNKKGIDACKEDLDEFNQAHTIYQRSQDANPEKMQLHSQTPDEQGHPEETSKQKSPLNPNAMGGRSFDGSNEGSIPSSPNQEGEDDHSASQPQDSSTFDPEFVTIQGAPVNLNEVDYSLGRGGMSRNPASNQIQAQAKFSRADTESD
jgi:hypothetical protein